MVWNYFIENAWYSRRVLKYSPSTRVANYSECTALVICDDKQTASQSLWCVCHCGMFTCDIEWKFLCIYCANLSSFADMLSQTVWTVAAAGVGLCFIGYCIYFDRKRRSDPFFRQKLRESKHMSSNLLGWYCNYFTKSHPSPDIGAVNFHLCLSPIRQQFILGGALLGMEIRNSRQEARNGGYLLGDRVCSFSCQLGGHCKLPQPWGFQPQMLFAARDAHYEMRRAKRSFEKKLAKNIDVDRKSFYAYVLHHF